MLRHQSVKLSADSPRMPINTFRQSLTQATQLAKPNILTDDGRNSRLNFVS